MSSKKDCQKDPGAQGKTLQVFNVDATPEFASTMQTDLESKGFILKPLPHAHFSAQSKDISCVLYRSGKLVVQGKNIKEFIQFYLEPEVLNKISFGYEELLQDQTPRMGSDEAGKGDYFGPLVIASAFIDPSTIPKLVTLGVKDSKRLSDATILKMASEIKRLIPHEVIKIFPKRYNEMYESFKNLNALLAWGHAAAIHNLSNKTGCKDILVDKFAHESVLERALRARKVELNLSQKTKGESDLAVAAASILARAGFLEGIDALAKKWQVSLPKGASNAVQQAAKEIVSKHGKELLSEVAKVHFIITQQVTGGES